MTGRLRLLFLSQTLPYPPDSGVKVRTFDVLRQLAPAFEITALCFYRRATLSAGGAEEAIRGLSPVADAEAFAIPGESFRPRRVWDHLRSGATGRVYTRFSYDARTFARALWRHLTQARWDLVHLDSLDLAYYLDRLGGARVIMVHHDIQSLLLSRRAELETTAWRRRWMAHQSRLMAREEATACPRANLNVVVSSHDRDLLWRQAPGACIAVVPNAVDLTRHRPGTQPREPSILFVGGSDWAPNLDAMEHFGRDILPEIRRSLPAVTVRWVGHAGEAVRASFRHRYDIQALGRVHDVSPHLANAGCVVVPLRAGSGTRIKILEAWAMAAPVVSTTIGCEGLDARPGDNLLRADEPSAFASAVVSVLKDPALGERLGRRGRETVAAGYDWAAVGEAMRRLYTAVARGDPAGDTSP